MLPTEAGPGDLAGTGQILVKALPTCCPASLCLLHHCCSRGLVCCCCYLLHEVQAPAVQVGGPKPLHVALALPKLERQASARKQPGGRAPAPANMPRPARCIRGGYLQPWRHVVHPDPSMRFNPNHSTNGYGTHGSGGRSPRGNPAANGNTGLPANGGGTANGGGARCTSSSTCGSPNDWAMGPRGSAPASGVPQGNGHLAGNGYGPAAASGNGYGGAASPPANGHVGAAANGCHAAGFANGAAAPHWSPHAMVPQQAGVPAHVGAPAMVPSGYPHGAPA